MFQDIGVSKNLIEQYRSYCAADQCSSNSERCRSAMDIDALRFFLP